MAETNGGSTESVEMVAGLVRGEGGKLEIILQARPGELRQALTGLLQLVEHLRLEVFRAELAAPRVELAPASALPPGSVIG